MILQYLKDSQFESLAQVSADMKLYIDKEYVRRLIEQDRLEELDKYISHFVEFVQNVVINE